ncbi:sulfatase-like hydrolase/transferase [bacterium]|nr:sulfatase-like hydrolase/transferase [bacterium]
MKKLLSALLLLLWFTLTARAEKPNVIIIYSDDHGYTDLGIHGIDANVDTPNMDALARGGVLMRAGYSSAPQCRPSRCGLLTGRIQNEFGFADNKADAGSGVGTLPRVYPSGTDMAGKPLLTIADRMKRLGYVTGFSGKWHCGLNHDPKEEYDPRSRGFDEYWVAPMTNGYTNLDLEGNLIPHQKKAEWPEELQNRVILQGKFAEAFVSRNKDKPFFLYFPIYGPHVPMIKKSDPYYKDFPKQDYPHYNDQQDDVRRQGLALLKAMDDAVGGLVQALQQHGLEKNTLILFAGDNGAPGKQTHNSPRGSWNGSNNVPLRGVKGWLHEGGIRVPMFAYWKGTIPAGQVVDEMVTTLDFTATTLALGGGVIPSEFDGVDLMPRMTGNVSKLTRDQPMYWDFYSGQAMRMGDWKLWRKDDTTVLFNIADDPSELTNLAYQHPDRVIEMSKQLDRWSESLPDSARYDPEKRGKNMISSLGGAPANIQPDPRYLVPYDNPVPTPYPTAVISPGGPAIIFESARPENKQVKPKENAKPEMIKNGKGSTNRSATGNRPNLEKLFQRRDQNQDGFVTLEEFIGDPETRNVTALTRVFNKRDVNRDGRLTLEEMQVKLD